MKGSTHGLWHVSEDRPGYTLSGGNPTFTIEIGSVKSPTFDLRLAYLGGGGIGVIYGLGVHVGVSVGVGEPGVLVGVAVQGNAGVRAGNWTSNSLLLSLIS